MEKQDKVLTKIKNSLKHGNEGQLGTKKNDECYTSMQDILNELSYWAILNKFRGKNIICPCDWDIVGDENIYSITITYKAEGIEVIGNGAYKTVESVQYDLWSNDDTPVITRITLKEEEIEDFLRDKLTCNFVRTLTQNARAWGIKSITASGFNPATGKGIKFQDVDYSKYDICITNPPFSLYSTFMECIVGKVDFIVLAPFLNRTNPCIGVPLMTRQAYLGLGVHLAMAFQNPTSANKFKVKSVACDWLVSYPEAQQERNNNNYSTGVSFELYKDDYSVMPFMYMKEGSNPIRVPSQFPEDYTDWMFGGINILDSLDQDSYEWYITHCTGYLNAHPEVSPFRDKIKEMVMLKGSDGKGNFGGIVFRKKSVGGTADD